jgi:hypothetical protein
MPIANTQNCEKLRLWHISDVTWRELKNVCAVAAVSVIPIHRQTDRVLCSCDAI